MYYYIYSQYYSAEGFPEFPLCLSLHLLYLLIIVQCVLVDVVSFIFLVVCGGLALCQSFNYIHTFHFPL